MTLYHLTILPVKVGSILFLDQAGNHQQADLTKYQRLIGKLMYLSYGTQPDIAFVMGQLSCHNSDSHVRHLYIAKQVFCYLKGIITLDIEWGNNPTSHKVGKKYRKIDLIGYADNSYISDIEDRNWITGYYFFFGRGVITWCNKQKQTVPIFIFEAKYVAVSQKIREGIWIWRLLNKLLPNKAIWEMKILGNNETYLTLTRDPKSQNRTKHIDMIYHYIHGLVKDREISIEWILSTDILADNFTKALFIELFKRH